MPAGSLPAQGQPRRFAAARDKLWYWLGLPCRWLYQIAHNGHGIVRVLDITRFRPLPAGLIGPEHPWATGVNPATGQPIWHENVLYQSPRGPAAAGLPDDCEVIERTGQFLAERVLQSAIVPEVPAGPHRRMPHGINYIHGTSHYNSGILVFTDSKDAFRHFTDQRFRAELRRFVRQERREVLILFRKRHYVPRQFAYLSCCLRSMFPWFCNANGPAGRVLWGNAAPFPAANLITGAWIRDVYALKRPGGADGVARRPVPQDAYFRAGPYQGPRDQAIWPEKALAWATYWRIRLRRSKGGMFFVDRRKVFADLIERQKAIGLPDEPIARF
jgi:hypothetical protein